MYRLRTSPPPGPPESVPRRFPYLPGRLGPPSGDQSLRDRGNVSEGWVLMTECRDLPTQAGTTSATLDILESQGVVNPAGAVRPTGGLYPRTPRYQPNPLYPADALHPAASILSPADFLAAPTGEEDSEIPLIGGDMTEGVVRVGRTVRRP